MEEYGENSATRVLRSFDRLIGWHVAALSIWNKNHTVFARKRIQVYQFRYDPSAQSDLSPTYIKAVLQRVDAFHCWTNSEIELVQSRARLASVHAEAALMCWAMSSDTTPYLPPTVSLSDLI